MLKLFKIEASGSASKWAHYLYDAGGDRVKKVVNKSGGIQEVTLYVDGVFEHTYTSTATVLNPDKNYNTIHIMDGRSRIATKRIGNDVDDDTPTIKYNLEDHLGTSSVTLDFSGDLINREEYYPFGESSFGGFTKKRFRYVGKEKDNESGLYYYGARYYAPWMCRFISIDPLASSYADLNPYNYAANDPIRDLDIDGMQSTEKDTTVTEGKGDNLGPITKGKNKSKSSKEAKTESNNVEGGITLDGIEISPEQKTFNEEVEALEKEYSGPGVEIIVHSEDDGNGNFKGSISVKGDGIDIESTTEYSNETKEDSGIIFEGNSNPEFQKSKPSVDLKDEKLARGITNSIISKGNSTIKLGETVSESGQVAKSVSKTLTKLGRGIGGLGAVIIIVDAVSAYRNGTFDWKDGVKAGIGLTLIAIGFFSLGPVALAALAVVSLAYAFADYYGYIDEALDWIEDGWNDLVRAWDSFVFDFKQFLHDTKESIRTGTIYQY